MVTRRSSDRRRVVRNGFYVTLSLLLTLATAIITAESYSVMLVASIAGGVVLLLMFVLIIQLIKASKGGR
jgi:hypothetical protein